MQSRRRASFFFFGQSVSKWVIALVMAIVAIGRTLDECRSLTSPRSTHCGIGGFPHFKNILAIDADPWHAVGGGPVRNTAASKRVFDWGGVGIEVVLTHKDDRQLPDRGKIHGFMDCAKIRGPIAEKSGGDPAVSRTLEVSAAPTA